MSPASLRPFPTTATSPLPAPTPATPTWTAVPLPPASPLSPPSPAAAAPLPAWPDAKAPLPLRQHPPAALLPLPPSPTTPPGDLQHLLAPMIREAVREMVRADSPPPADLEPMLRAAIRRVLAESPTPPPQPAKLLTRLSWRLNALLTGKSYETVAFEKSKRFQIEEVFLLNANSLALVSHASNTQHSQPDSARSEARAQRLARQLTRSEDGSFPLLRLPKENTALTCQGQYLLLVAITRGTPDKLLKADLDFMLSRIEERFRSRFSHHASPLLHELRPYLEDCLLIQARAA